MVTPNNPVCDKSRKLARLLAWIHCVIHMGNVLLAIGLLVTTIWMGYEMFGGDSEGRNSDPDATLKIDTLSQLDVSVDEKTLYLGMFAIETGSLFAISVPQSFGAYRLLQATKMNIQMSEAILKVDTHQKIQQLFLWIDAARIISSIFMNADVDFVWEVLLVFVVLLFRYASIQGVDQFRSELLAANNETVWRKNEKEKVVKNKAVGPRKLSVDAPE